MPSFSWSEYGPELVPMTSSFGSLAWAAVAKARLAAASSRLRRMWFM